jgi:hypothetical protein
MMDNAEAERLAQLFELESAKIQQVVGARGMEYTWNGQRFADINGAKGAIRRFVRDASLHPAAFRSSSQKLPSNTSQPSETSGNLAGVLWGIASAVFVAAIVIGAEILLVLTMEGLFGRHVVPRGAGWLLLPIMALIAGYRMGPLAAELIARQSSSAFRLSEIRMLFAGSAFWCVAVLLFVVMFEPFGYYMRERDYWTVGKVMSFPIILASIALCLLSWLRKQSS